MNYWNHELLWSSLASWGWLLARIINLVLTSVTLLLVDVIGDQGQLLVVCFMTFENEDVASMQSYQLNYLLCTSLCPKAH